MFRTTAGGTVGKAAAAVLTTIALAALLGAAAVDAADTDQGLADFRHGRFAEAFEDWQRAAAAGDPRGALFIGVLYDSGLGVGQNEGQAMDWYRRAAEAGSAAAAFNVGVLYDAGLGVPKDPATAAEWYDRAASAGFGRAEYNLAMLYESGTGVPRDRARAVTLYRRAALHGIAAANGHLAALGQPFAGVPEKPKDTAMQQFQEAQKMLLTRGSAEAARAVVLFRQAADQHNALAEYDLGYCYERGLGVPLDQAQAYEWYRRAAGDAADDGLRAIAQSSAGALATQVGHAQPSTPRPGLPTD